MNAIESYKRLPFLYLFVTILAIIVLSPLLEDRFHGRHIIQILFTLMTVAVVNATSGRRRHFVVALALAVPWMSLSWLAELQIWNVPTWIVHGLAVTLNAYVVCVVLQIVVRAKDIDSNILAGSLALYLLLALTWALSYVMIEELIPGSFSPNDAPIPWHKYLYLSLSTITTLGYGDFVPVSPFARIWATLEAVTGVLYVAVLVARLVSLYRA